MTINLSGLADYSLPVDQTDAFTTGAEIASRFSSQITNKIILITGVTRGSIGHTTALSLATGSPSLLILAGRNSTSLSATIADIKALNPRVQTLPLIIDLSSLRPLTASTESLFCNPFLSFPHLDILINCAGIAAPPFSVSADGFESQFAVNHLGHFQLTRLLVPKLRASPDGGRVVNVTATGHRFGPGVRFEDVDFASGEEYDPWVAYAQAKGANVLHAVGLVKLGVVKRAVAVNPGATAGTGLYQGENGKDGAGFGEGRRLKTPEEAAGSVVFAALAEEVVDGYWEDCRAGRAAAWAEDEGNAERLWRLSEGLVDQALRK